MNNAQSDALALPKPLRLWPGILAVSLQWIGRFVIPKFFPEAAIYGVLGAVVFGLAILVWWAFFSRAPRAERWSGVALLLIIPLISSRLNDKSIATGAMGFLFVLYLTPILSLAFVLWAVTTRQLSAGLRRASMIAAIVIVCGGFTLIRTNGLTGEASSDFSFRWSKTPEERLLAQAVAEPVAIPPASPATLPATPVSAPVVAPVSAPAPIAAPATLPTVPPSLASPAIWPGFRGPARNSIVHGAHIETDWSSKPPAQLWRRPVGPGWSSFAVHGDFLYTQEQRGDEEVVACYNATTGKPVWIHKDSARFWESNAGAGPRGTPTLSNGRVYAFGATGILNALNEADGSVVWSRNAGEDTKVKVPGWGFSSSPLVLDDLVIIAASGKLAAFDLATGAPKWNSPSSGGGGYSSPHLITIDGVSQIALLSGGGVISVSPADGKLLWEHKWPADPRIVQPAITPDGDILISTSDSGMRRLHVTHGSDGWTVQERWTSMGLKPNFNDFVVHHGHAFGFDGTILSCIDLEDGKRKWKGGRYGGGQFVLLPDQDLLLVVSEEGELALVAAGTDQFKEIARIPGIEGKTWNHPVLAGNVLFVRNSQEMAAFRLR